MTSFLIQVGLPGCKTNDTRGGSEATKKPFRIIMGRGLCNHSGQCRIFCDPCCSAPCWVL